jgi:alanyl-tRNA synthetase
VNLAKTYVFDSDDPVLLITFLIKRSRNLAGLAALDRRLEEVSAENAAMIAARASAELSPRVIALRKEFALAQERIARLKKVIFESESEQLKATIQERKVTGQARLAKEGAEVEALSTEVEALEKKVQGLEKRVMLMRQRRSQYAPYFTENPDPSLRIDGRIEDVLRRFAEDDPTT